MSVIFATGDQITKHQLNNSTAKQSFSFSKSSRFRTKVDRYYQFSLHNNKLQFLSSHNQFLYTLPSTKTKRACGFGYGTKFDFYQHKNINPSPNVYDIGSTFNDLKKKKGYSIRSRVKR